MRSGRRRRNRPRRSRSRLGRRRRVRPRARRVHRWARSHRAVPRPGGRQSRRASRYRRRDRSKRDYLSKFFQKLTNHKPSPRLSYSRITAYRSPSSYLRLYPDRPRLSGARPVHSGSGVSGLRPWLSRHGLTDSWPWLSWPRPVHSRRSGPRLTWPWFTYSRPRLSWAGPVHSRRSRSWLPRPGFAYSRPLVRSGLVYPRPSGLRSRQRRRAPRRHRQRYERRRYLSRAFQ